MRPFTGQLRAVGTAGATIALLLTTGLIPATAAQEPTPLTNLQLDLALNQEYQNPDSRGGICNFFSAGTGDNGGEFREQVGDVSIVKIAEDGSAQRASRASICLPMTGTSVNQRARFSHGEGELDPATGAGEVRWSGAFTANAYGGLVPWTFADPVLTIAADGTGTLTGTAGGYGANEENPEGTFPLTPRPVTLATFSSVSVEAGVVEFTPDFYDRDYFPLNTPGNPDSGRSTTSAVLKTKGAWGSWPESLIDFHYDSGLTSYWYTSGGSADPHKVPLPVRVTATAEAPVERPLITENPKANLEFPVLEGNDLEITAAASGATAVSWERKASGDAEWTVIEGASDPTLRIPAITADWNQVSVRMVAENRGGKSYSGVLKLHTETPDELRISTPPTAVLAIEGMRPVLDFSVTGTPAPSEFVVEEQTEDGTWLALSGIDVARGQNGSTHRIMLPEADRAGSSKLRVQVKNRLGQSVTSAATEYRVVANTGEPQLALNPAGGLTAAEGGEITVVGANFVVPANDKNGYFGLDVALFDDEDWQPGQEGSQRWVATSADTEWGQLNQAVMSASGGSFTVRIQVDADALDPTRSYGVATFLRHTNLWWMASYDDRRADSFTRLALEAPELAPDAIAESALNDDNRGGVTVQVHADGTVTATVPGERPDSQVFLSAYSDYAALGWHRLDSAQRVTATLPANLAAGDHRLVVQRVTGELLGWAEFEVQAAVGEDGTGGTQGSGTGSGQQGGAVAPAKQLAHSGAEASTGALIAGAALLTLGAGALLLRRRTKA